MKLLINVIVLICLMSQAVFADCDFSTGITPGPNKTYVYSEACHQAVGAMVKQIKDDSDQIADYKKAIYLKDLALTESDQRVQLWSDTSAKLEDRLTKVDRTLKHNESLYFILGIATAIGTGFMASSLLRR